MKPSTSSRLEQFERYIHDTDKKIKSIIRRLTHSGETELNKDDLTELKKICQASSDDLMVVVYKQCFKCLRKEHAQVRVSTVKLIDYLFVKSYVMRSELLDHFDTFLELTLAITQRPKIMLRLPPPKKYATLLQELTAKTIHKWHADFGQGYEKLRYAYRFLKEHKLVDFAAFQVTNHEQLSRQQKLAEQQNRVLTRSIENRLKEYRELKPELEQLIAQIESLIDLLVPQEVTELQPIDLQQADEADVNIARQQHGIANLSQSINIQFDPVIEIAKDEENKDLVTNLKELKRELINAKLVRLIAVEKTISKRSDKFLDTLREIIDIKSRATSIILKLGELKIVYEYKDENGDSGDGDEADDFQDVEPKEDLETYIPKSMRYEYGLEPIDPRELANVNRITLTEEIFNLDEMPSTSKGPAASTSNTSLPLACNVPLDSGKLCPRRDKVKCPFHGKIIPRDHLGIPIYEEDRRREDEERKRKSKQNVPDWQDPELLSDIRAATGVDLTMPARSGKSKRLSPKKPLANTKTCDLTPKQRLQKKLKLLVKWTLIMSHFYVMQLFELCTWRAYSENIGEFLMVVFHSRWQDVSQLFPLKVDGFWS